MKHLSALLSALLFAAVFAAPACAADAPLEKPAAEDLDTMNSYSLKQFGDFTSWHLVTARFRKDTREMRITYANDIAWKALLQNSTDYPDGAIFAKIGLLTQDDPAFASSAVPSGAKRYQFMVRDKKGHADTSGWGYAMFNAEGKTYNVDPLNKGPVTAAACDACHQLVPQRGYVFSQPMLESIKLPNDIGNSIFYSTEKRANLPRKVAKEIPDAFAEADVVQGSLSKHLFQGTLDEIRPTLAKRTLKTRIPAILMSEDGSRFSMVFVDPYSPDCKTPDKEKKDGILMRGVITTSPSENKNYLPQSFSYCELKPD